MLITSSWLFYITSFILTLWEINHQFGKWRILQSTFNCSLTLKKKKTTETFYCERFSLLNGWGCLVPILHLMGFLGQNHLNMCSWPTRPLFLIFFKQKNVIILNLWAVFLQVLGRIFLFWIFLSLLNTQWPHHECGAKENTWGLLLQPEGEWNATFSGQMREIKELVASLVENNWDLPMKRHL